MSLASACDEKLRLMEQLKLVNHRLHLIHEREIACLTVGDFTGFEALEPALLKAREYRDAIAASLRSHVHEHGC